jgi:hypothetical protein
MMQEQYVNSIPVGRGFHLPFFDGEEREDRGDYECALVSAARCARLSYTPHGEPARNIEADLALAERLLTSRHLSPFEHIIWGEAEGANAISHRVVTLRQSLGF